MVLEEIADKKSACTRLRYRKLSGDDAFQLQKRLQELAPTNIKWNVGLSIKDRIVFDLDHHDEEMLYEFLAFQKKNLGLKGFHVIKTLHGYHCISVERIQDMQEWKKKVCLSLHSSAIEYISVQKYTELIR